MFKGREGVVGGREVALMAEREEELDAVEPGERLEVGSGEAVKVDLFERLV